MKDKNRFRETSKIGAERKRQVGFNMQGKSYKKEINHSKVLRLVFSSLKDLSAIQ
jgi:hypothetical protein